MINQENIPLRVARYGVPAVILMYYVTASFAVSYTPDSTFDFLFRLDHPEASVALWSPLWEIILTIAVKFGLQPLLAAKALSLFFASLGVMVGYLVAHEVLRDRISALFVIVAVYFHGWMIAGAVGGSQVMLGLLLLFAAMFYMLRNEYAVAAACAGLCTLVFCQSIAVVGVIVLDNMLNTIERRQARKNIMNVVVVYLTMLIPWVTFALLSGRSIIPSGGTTADLPSVAVWTLVIAGVLFALDCAGLFLNMKEGTRSPMLLRHVPQMAIAVLAIGALLGEITFWILIIPFLGVYGFLGLQVFMGENQLKRTAGTGILMLVILGTVQYEFQTVTGPSMQRTVEEQKTLIAVAEWVRKELPAASNIEGSHPGILSFYSGREIRYNGSGDLPSYIVSTGGTYPGYEVIYAVHEDLPTKGNPDVDVRVWRKQ